MKIAPKAKCPKCKGPVSFLDVLSIITPFQSISCASCGEPIFLMHRWGVTLVALGVGMIVLLLSLGFMIQGLMTSLQTYIWAALVLLLMELAVTLRVVKKNELVVRKEE
jgi:prepilin signal peptidase PulO-like enzyme (type II secretory pathway)